MVDSDTIEMEFDGMTADEFRDLMEEVKATIADFDAGLCDTELASLRLPDVDAKSVTAGDFAIRRGQQLTGLEASLVLIAAHSGAAIGRKIILDIWTGIVFPRVRARYGHRVRIRRHGKG